MLAATEIVTAGGSLLNVYGPLDPAGFSSVSPTTSFHVRFSRLLDPTTATRQSICVQDLLTNVVDPSGCSHGLFTEPSYDPVKREVDYHLTSGNLIAGRRYELTLYSGQQSGSGGVFSYDGVPLAQPYKVEFAVLDPGDVLPRYDTGPIGDHFCNPPPGCRPGPGITCARSVSVILGRCALGGCHGNSSSPDVGAAGPASEGLLLGTLAGLASTALNHPAHETETGENADKLPLPDQSPRFGQNMAVLSHVGPGYSYLVYKLLANRHTPLRVPWSDGSPTADPTEVSLLRRNLVAGMPMPPDTTPSADLLPGEPEWLSEWLLQGAPVPAEPCGTTHCGTPDGGVPDGGELDGGMPDCGAPDGGM